MQRTRGSASAFARGEPLINDGLSGFGFAGHLHGDEIMVGKYNVVTIYSTDLEKYRNFFEPHKILCGEHLVTAGDTSSAEHPSVSGKYLKDGKDILCFGRFPGLGHLLCRTP